MKKYLSGPMARFPNRNYDEFNRVAKLLRKDGHKIINPAEESKKHKLNKTKKWTWKIAIINDIIKILKSNIDTIILLPGWEFSEGAKIELFILTKIFKCKVVLFKELPLEKSYELVPIEIDFSVNAVY